MPYSETSFLIDHLNVTDTINRLWLSVDRQDWTTIAERVFAKEVIADSTQLIPGSPVETRSSLAQTEWFKASLESTIVVDLPRPSETYNRPSEVKATVTGFNALVKNTKTTLMGAWYELKLVREDTSTASGKNPWRISFVKPQGMWTTENNSGVLDLK
ncbi:hypothetical protein BDV98DRAFT_593109 [Pterulicium gracile]|uniref:Uncharacterized protein n=1 Tax=Pterulicium gracile TaxID=1884261 RepID=A0A5C3QI72_9AGAR|nr:hypothetical protein BDV98DRAFT_593109 [Pterula gracilis]